MVKNATLRTRKTRARNSSAEGAKCNSPAQGRVRDGQSAESAKCYGPCENISPNTSALITYSALSALRLNTRARTRAVGPGYYISHLRCFKTEDPNKI